MKVILDIRLTAECTPTKEVSDLAERMQQAVQQVFDDFAHRGLDFARTETDDGVMILEADVLMDPEIQPKG